MEFAAALPVRHIFRNSSQMTRRSVSSLLPRLQPAISTSHSMIVPHICSRNVSREDRIVTVILMSSIIFAVLSNSLISLEYLTTLRPISLVSFAFSRPNRDLSLQALATCVWTSSTVCFSSFHRIKANSGSRSSTSSYHFEARCESRSSCLMLSSVFCNRSCSGEQDMTSHM